MPSTYGSLDVRGRAAGRSGDGLVPRRLRAAGRSSWARRTSRSSRSRDTRATVVRNDDEPLGDRVVAGGIERRLGCGARVGDGGDRDRDRRRRVDPDPRRVLRTGRTEADERRDRPRADPRLDRPLDVRSVRDVDRGPAVVARRSRPGPVPGDPSALPFPLPMGDGMPKRVVRRSGRFAGALPLPIGCRKSGSTRPRVGGTGPRSAGRDARARLDLPDGLDGRGLVHALRGRTPAQSRPRRSSEANMERFSPDFRWTMTQALAIIVDRYMTARRRRFDYVARPRSPPR